MKIVEIKPSSNRDAIELMEETLEKIKSGEITSIALSWVTKDGSISGDISSGDTALLLWSAIRHTEISFYNDVINQE